METRKGKYRVIDHETERKRKRKPTNRKEEHLAIHLRNTFENIIIDYQIPLKDKRSDKSGKIDLLMDKDGSLVIVELKGADNEEPLLRPVLEIETYHRLLDEGKLCEEYGRLKHPVGKAIMIFAGTEPFRDYKSKRKSSIKKLIQKYNIHVYLTNGENFKRI